MKSMLDTDLYKFSTSYAYFSLYPNAEGTFTFNDRAKESWMTNLEILDEFNGQMKMLEEMSLSHDEMTWCIEHIPYIPASYWEWLSSFRFDSSKIFAYIDADGVFQCRVTDTLYKVTLYEIPVLATYAQLRNKYKGVKLDTDNAMYVINRKIDYANEHELPFAEFGTRRRFSADLHEQIINAIVQRSKTCVGTSNVYFAMKYNMIPSGTFPHEWMMFHAGVFGYKRANYLGLEDWIKVYDGNLGTALVDTYTTASFLRTLTRKQALLLSGYRIDSGDNMTIANMIIERLKEFNIDPRTKLLVFSNALDFERYNDIYKELSGMVKVSAGIGTNITCDPGIDGYKAANIVMKLSRCRMSDKDPWEQCIKISDDYGKHMGDATEFKIAAHELHL